MSPRSRWLPARARAEGAAPGPTPARALATLCLTQIVSWGVLFYSFPVALPAITSATGWSSTATTGAFSAGLIVAAAAGIPVGRLLDRRGPRAVMTAGSVVAAIATITIATAPSVRWFAVAWMLAGLAQSAVLYPAAFTALTRWYGPSRTRALTTLTLVAGLSSTVFAPLTAALLDHTGWRQTYLVLALILALTTIPAHALGLSAPWPAADHDGNRLGPARRSRVRAIAGSRAFVCLTIATALTAFALFAATVHLVPLLTGRGLSASLAAWALGLSGAGQLLGRTGYAPLARHTTPLARTVALILFAAATIAAVALFRGPAAVLVTTAVALGVARGAFTLLQSTAISDRWGTTGFGALYGILNAPATVAMALAPWAGSALAGTAGSYPAMFALLAVVTVAAAAAATGSTHRRPVVV